MNIELNGKYYQRGDAKKRPVTILSVTAAAPYSVAYLCPERRVLCTTSTGLFYSSRGASGNDLLPMPADPVLVPFTRETWPGSRYVRQRIGDQAMIVCNIGDDGVFVSGYGFAAWETLRVEFTHSDTHRIDGAYADQWQPCGTSNQ